MSRRKPTLRPPDRCTGQLRQPAHRTASEGRPRRPPSRLRRVHATRLRTDHDELRRKPDFLSEAHGLRRRAAAKTVRRPSWPPMPRPRPQRRHGPVKAGSCPHTGTDFFSISACATMNTTICASSSSFTPDVVLDHECVKSIPDNGATTQPEGWCPEGCSWEHSDFGGSNFHCSCNAVVTLVETCSAKMPGEWAW